MAERKRWQDLTITDDYMFKLVMSYPHICKHLIESVLNKYKDLGNAAVIFFCPFELYGGQRRMYTFENICREDKSLTLDDGMIKVMLSSAGAPTDDIDSDVAAFLEYMNGKITENGFISEIDETIRSVKMDGTKEAGYMTFEMMIDEEREEAREEGKREIIIGMLENGISIETVANVAKLSLEEVMAIKESCQSSK